MKMIFVTLVASLVVIFALFVLISEDQSRMGSGGLTIGGDRGSGLGEGLLGAVLSQRKNESESTPSSNIVKAQRALMDDGFYSGPLDGTMSDRTREALRSFQRSRQINVTGKMDDETSRQLGVQED
jgi:peptidoglycan hydrolase-like protein with peptidoglycan-binding domain